MEASLHLKVVCIEVVLFRNTLVSENSLRGQAWRMGPFFGFAGNTNESGSRW